MTKSKFRFEARLLQPAKTGKGSSWAFVVLPSSASAKLPARGMRTVKGTLNGHPFRATLEPDGKRGHWLKVHRKLREAAGAAAGNAVTVEITSTGEEPEIREPAGLRKALAATPKARATWSDITANARRDWIHWITSAKQAETRARRIVNPCEMLAGGTRRVCFDRSGYYSKSFGAPQAAG